MTQEQLQQEVKKQQTLVAHYTEVVARDDFHIWQQLLDIHTHDLEMAITELNNWYHVELLPGAQQAHNGEAHDVYNFTYNLVRNYGFDKDYLEAAHYAAHVVYNK